MPPLSCNQFTVPSLKKTYGGNCSADPSAIVSLVSSLHKRIREAVEQASLAMPVGDIDWETQVLEPIIANFHVIAELGISAADVEYLILVGTVIILSYETLLVPEMQRRKSTCAFLTKIFAEYLCEPDIHHRITERLRLEQRRLEVVGATSAIQEAVRTLRLMLPDIWTSIVAWEKPLPEPHVSNTTDAHEDADANSRPFPRDLHISVSLKPGQSLPVDFVECIDTLSGNVVVKTHFGLRSEVQSDVRVSNISGMFDAVTLSVEDAQATSLAATIIVPPGYYYRATNVESVFK